jgi:hypothetical protein
MDGQNLSPHELILCLLPPLSAPKCLVLFSRTTNEEEENKNKFSNNKVNMEKEDRQLEIEEKTKSLRKRKGKQNTTM